MTRVVLDTNVLVSGMIKRTGPPGRLLAAQRQRLFDLVISEPLLVELQAVLLRPPILEAIHAVASEIDEFVAQFESVAIFVTPKIHVDAIARDPADNRVLEAAIAGHADFIVSGDQDLLELVNFESIPIITPARFLAIISHTSQF